MTDTMNAVSQDELGGPEVLKLVTLPIPEPGVSEIVVRVHAAGVNPIDGAQRQTGAFVGQPPFVLGWDVSGTVEAVGPGVTLYKPGDDVFGLLPFPQGHGAYAEYAVGPTRGFVRERVRNRKRHEEGGRHRGEDDEPRHEVLDVDGVRHPRVRGPGPPDHGEHEDGASETCGTDVSPSAEKNSFSRNPSGRATSTHGMLWIPVL